MYRLTLYYLIFLVGSASLLSFLGFFKTFSFDDILISSGIVIITSYISNYIFSKLLSAPTNVESVYITALILVLIVPVRLPVDLPFLVAASVVAMASKYLLTIEKTHVFNPAAVSVAAIALLSPEHTATWWIGTPIMFPFVLAGGLLLIRKIERANMVFTFLIAYLVIIGSATILSGGSIFKVWEISLLRTALLFFAFVMFTEPITSPSVSKFRDYYAYVVAFFYATPQLNFLSIGLTPEIALLLGNVFSYIVNPKYKLVLPLKFTNWLSPTTAEFAFALPQKIKFNPGQYMEWTLPHKNTDSRGNRRYFSISSTPNEEDLKVTVRFNNPSSSYKQFLSKMREGDKIFASQLSGDFVLSDDPKPIALIAGGVGVAPFKSMIQDIIEKGIKKDIILIYSNKTEDEIIFKDLFEKAKGYGVKTVYVLTDVEHLPLGWTGEKGRLNQDKIREIIPDYNQRIFYLSGPQLMVQSFQEILKEMGVKRTQVKKDFFPGYEEK